MAISLGNANYNNPQVHILTVFVPGVHFNVTPCPNWPELNYLNGNFTVDKCG